MDLFRFFKRKEEVKIDFRDEKDISKIIGIGVFFEDIDKFLRWGSPIKVLAREVTAKEKIFADRVIYNWGEHSILGGLKLELTTVCWDHKQESSVRKLESIEFRAAGNDIAEKYKQIITAHIEKVFGKPGKSDASTESVTLEWIINDARIFLYFF